MIRAPSLLERSHTHYRMALLIVRHHHYYPYYCNYCYYGNANNKELAFFNCPVWNIEVAVLQPSGARLLLVMLLAWPGVCSNMGALGWHWITSQGGGESDPAELGEIIQNSLERNISKSCSWAKLKCCCRCTLQCVHRCYSPAADQAPFC